MTEVLLRWITLVSPIEHALRDSHTGITYCGIQTDRFGGGKSGAPAPSKPKSRTWLCLRCRQSIRAAFRGDSPV